MNEERNEERKLALFIDFENIARGVKEAQYKGFEIKLVLERLVEKGKIMVRRAYADWSRYAEYKRPFHEHAIELIDVPQSRYSGKNSADIRMVVDAMDLAYSKAHVDTFALISGDSDFSPLVSKLRENDRYVIGLGVKSSSSELLVSNCDEFIFYEDLIREAKKTTLLRGLPEKKAEAFAQLIDAVQALQRENKEVLWGSMVKQTMIRKNPAFNESYYGYSTFSKLLEEAAKQKVLTLERDAKSGTYIITSIAEEGRAA
ncbi:MAG: NYN domain-containing protein [Candidatus Rokubacteria bacterium]|nr:NYN domain-containing protein [Candidatus Rokubacteria bacterium]MBI2553147.1 NYN domain-containing protein [Candidatus Rokubacteria bacterium]